MCRRSELCTFKFQDITKDPNGKTIIKLNLSKTDQYGAGKVLPISEKLLQLIKKWRDVVERDIYILRSINQHDHIGNNLNPVGISTILKTLQEELKLGSNKKTLSGQSFRIGAGLDLLDKGERLERIMLR